MVLFVFQIQRWSLAYLVSSLEEVGDSTSAQVRLLYCAGRLILWGEAAPATGAYGDANVCYWIEGSPIIATNYLIFAVFGRKCRSSHFLFT